MYINEVMIPCLFAVKVCAQWDPGLLEVVGPLAQLPSPQGGPGRADLSLGYERRSTRLTPVPRGGAAGLISQMLRAATSAPSIPHMDSSPDSYLEATKR